jgi:hypothetical protein
MRVVKGRRGGEVTVVDSSDARSLIVLGTGDGPRTVLAPESGVGGAPPAGSHDDDEIWITMRVKPFRVVLDTSDLPGGALTFDESRFLERVQKEGELRGSDVPSRVKLTRATASEWGLVDTEEKADKT